MLKTEWEIIKIFLLFDFFRKAYNLLLHDRKAGHFLCFWLQRLFSGSEKKINRYLFYTNGRNFDISLVFLFATNGFSEKFTGMLSGAHNETNKKRYNEKILVFKITFFKGRTSLTRKSLFFFFKEVTKNELHFFRSIYFHKWNINVNALHAFKRSFELLRNNF